jgi:hypothetical protein
MRSRLVVACAALIAVMGGLFALPAGAANSTTVNVVTDAGTGTAWSGSETFGSSAVDTAVVVPDVSTPAGGTLTYSLFSNGSCSGAPATNQSVQLSNGTVPNSDSSGALNAGTYSYDATYNGDGTNDPAPGVCASFDIGRATPSAPVISNEPANASWGPGGGFTAALTNNGSDGTPSVTSSTTGVCSASGLSVTYVSAGQCTLTPHTAASTNFAAAAGNPQGFTIAQANPGSPTISDLPTNALWGPGGGFTATVLTSSDGSRSVISSTPGVCTASGLSVTYVSAGVCTLTAQTGSSSNFPASSGSPQSFTIAQASPGTPIISNLPAAASWGPGGGFTASVTGAASDGAQSVTSGTPTVCTASGLTVTYASAGLCTLTAQTAATTNFPAGSGSPQSFTIAQATPITPTITNLPASGVFGQNFTAKVTTSGDGVPSVKSTTPGVCSTNGLVVTYVGVGTCALNAELAASVNYVAAAGVSQTFTVGRAVPTTPTITNIPSPANEFFGFTAIVGTTGDGTITVTSNTPNVCSVDTNELTVTFVGFGTCSLTPHLAQSANYFGASGSPQAFMVQEASHGYWLVGSDGGIFSFGTAAFHGSTGSLHLQRPVVAITPTSTGNGYWLVASDGGIFSFGDSSYYGSLPGLGFHPNGSGMPQSLNAPIVGMVPTFTGHGYFMVASDGGVFAFGDAEFEGSCPGIGGCAGSAVSVMPDHTGNGYWLVTNLGAVYAFGDAAYYGGPKPASVPVVDAVATANGQGYWLLYANGVVANFGDATNFGAPAGYVNGFNPATTIFPTIDNQGYWVASARGDVFAYGDSPYLGSMAAAGLNGEIIGAFGF